MWKERSDEGLCSENSFGKTSQRKKKIERKRIGLESRDGWGHNYDGDRVLKEVKYRTSVGGFKQFAKQHLMHISCMFVPHH